MMWNVQGGTGCVGARDEEIDERDMEKISALDASEKTIAILGDGWWPQTAVQEGVEYVTFQGYLFAINIVC